MGEDDQLFAARFAKWQKAARDAKGWNIPKLAAVTEYSDSQVRIYDAEARGGFDVTGRYRRPKREYVEAIARATGADLTEGLIAAQLVLETPQELTRELTDEEWELIELFRGVRPEQRDLYLRLMASSVEVKDKEPNPEDVPLVN